MKNNVTRIVLLLILVTICFAHGGCTKNKKDSENTPNIKKILESIDSVSKEEEETEEEPSFFVGVFGVIWELFLKIFFAIAGGLLSLLIVFFFVIIQRGIGKLVRYIIKKRKK